MYRAALAAMGRAVWGSSRCNGLCVSPSILSVLQWQKRGAGFNLGESDQLGCDAYGK